jgi:autotransporter-associated beta strand protein
MAPSCRPPAPSRPPTESSGAKLGLAAQCSRSSSTTAKSDQNPAGIFSSATSSSDRAAAASTSALGSKRSPDNFRPWQTTAGAALPDNLSATCRRHSPKAPYWAGGSNGLLPGGLGSPSSVAISAGATFKFNRGSNKSFFDIFSGAGGITVANTPTAKVRLVSNNTYIGPTTISSGILMIGQGNPGEPGSIASSVVNNSGTLRSIASMI